jgi:hypothetical protein
MFRICKSPKKIVEELLDKAIEDGECWLCHLAPNAKGYSNVTVGGRTGDKWRVHRLVYTIINGPIPDGQIILHKCDTPRCIRPDHLTCGTHAENIQDMINKGRSKLANPRTDHVHREQILALHKQGLDRFTIARQLFVSPSTVWNYVSPRGPYYG